MGQETLGRRHSEGERLPGGPVGTRPERGGGGGEEAQEGGSQHEMLWGPKGGLLGDGVGFGDERVGLSEWSL